MLFAYYLTFFIISVILSVSYVFMWHRHFNVNITCIFLIVPLLNLSYSLLYDKPDLHGVYVALKYTYFGGCMLSWFMAFAIFDLCGVVINRWFRTGSFLVSVILYGSVLTMEHKGLFYKSLSISEKDGWVYLDKEYGIFHDLFYAMIVSYYVVTICVIIYTFRRKKLVSRKLLKILLLPHSVAVVGYFLNHFFSNGIEVMPVIYVTAQFLFLLIVRRMSLYNVGDVVVEGLVRSGDTGFITMDYKYDYLGSNETAQEILPALKKMPIDGDISQCEELKKNVYHWVSLYAEDKAASKNMYIRHDPEGGEDRMYSVRVSDLSDGFRMRGYQVLLTDDTQNQKYIRLLDKYNNELEEEVEKKTASIIQMHDNLVLSMATMVESRDNSTGGHIRRTSEGVRLLIEEMKKDKTLDLNDEFCEDIIKAAPMHDLGKIAVDDAILRKPGRFTPEEFEVMKKHAAEGAKIVHEILKGTDDESFKKIAENVAHYHHERWDGSGYPEGLKGEEIPMEARIMAIADVYDALVSKRVYKDSMSFEAADKIIMEGFGKHFDEKLKKYYLLAKPKLEKFYSTNT